MHCDVHCYPTKFEIELQHVHGEKKLCYGIKWTKLHSLGGKLNQVIV